jgi:hypothetical protein
MPNEKSDKNLIGAAGEHLVLSRLLAKGVLASLAPRGTRKADILVNPLDDGFPILIQVKTRSGRGGRKNWMMNEKHEEMSEPNLFYCFVNLLDINPEVYVIPSNLIAEIIKSGHQIWLETPGRKNQKHNNSSMRMISDNPGIDLKFAQPGWMDEYLENWDLILGLKK